MAWFPCHSRLQSLIACSMRVQRRKAWEIWSCVVTSGRQRVDTWGAVPNWSPSGHVHPSTGSQSVWKAATIPFTIHDAKNGLLWNRNYYGWTLTLVYLPSVYLTSLHMTRSPRPSPSYLCTASDQDCRWEHVCRASLISLDHC